VGVFAIIAGCGNAIVSYATLFLPIYAPMIGKFATILHAGELALIWMLIWGAKDQQPRAVPALA
jgi:hypothetical protein